MQSTLAGAAAAAALAFLSPAQAPARPVPPFVPIPVATQGQPAMLATERFLFVLRGDELFQFDLRTLALLHRFTLPPPGQPADVAPPAPRAQVPEPMVGEEPPPPPPPPAADKGPVAASIDAALQWLARHQDDDGRWDADQFMKHDPEGQRCDGPGIAVHDVGVTGLAMLAMLGSGSTLRNGPFRDHLKRAAHWLRNQQQENGLIGTNASHDFVYDHAIAAFALCEAYGLSNYNVLKPVAQRAIDYLESHRNPYAVWRYQPRDNDNDTSVTTWAVAACASAKYFGLQVNENALQLAATWYDQVTSPDGRAGYTKQGEPSSRKPGDHAQRFPVELGEGMTAAALYGRLLLGQDPKKKRVLVAAADRLLAKPPAWKPDRIDAVYWYFGTFAMFQMGGKYWGAWQDALAALPGNQRTDGSFAGSWDPVGVWDGDGGRVFVTALYALALQTSHRYTKLVR